MKETAIVYSPKYLEHNPGRGHPESAERLKVIMDELEKSGILENSQVEVLVPEPAGEDEIALVHRPDYIELVKKVCSQGGGLLDLGELWLPAKASKLLFTLLAEQKRLSI